MFVDAHSHLDFKEFKDDIDTVVSNAASNGIGLIITSGTDYKSSLTAIELADKYPQVYASVGIHPHEADKTNPNDLIEIEKLLAHPKVVAIGEMGLDYHYSFSGKEAQLTIFKALLALARSKDMPVVIHARAAENEALAEVLNAGVKKALFHCYTGTVETGKAIQSTGFFIGVTGIITFKNPSNALLVSQLNPQYLLTETDAPFLAPVPKRGARNEPANINLIFQKLSSLFPETSQKDLEATIINNIKTLFGISPT